MCGIVGIVEPRNVQPQINEQILKSMTDSIAHRGPDDEGQWMANDRTCGFGFRRLSIIDLSSAGHQPMSTPDGRYTIVFNGEIYNHASIRHDLEQKGYVYRSRTDTETILYGYQEYGVELLQRMVGMWDLAIWDNNTKELFCARDRIGIKPLYYSYQQGRFIFASEIKAILRHPSMKAEMNREELPNYLCFSMSSEHSTLFQHIHKLPAGHYLHLTSDGSLQIQRYWSPLRENTAYTTMDATEIRNEIMRLLRQAVKDRMMSDVPFGAFLSGGIDSSVNVALMAELMDRPVDTFTVGFKELEKYNELEHARKIRDVFQTNHHEILIDHTDVLPMLETMAWHEDEPNGDPVCIPLYFLSQLTRKSGTTVIQVGEGSDEQFVGYPWLVREWNFYNKQWAWFNKMPGFLKSSLYAVSKPFFQRGGNYLALDYLRRAAQGNELYWGGGVDLTPSHLEILLSSSHRQLATIPPLLPARIHEEARNRSPKGDYIQEMAFYELAHRLPELLLMRVDKMTMAHSLEARVPFLDHRLVEFSMTIPWQQKLPEGNATKVLLKKAVEDILPHDIIYRKKQGFAAPVSEWFRTHWYEYARHEILQSPLMKTGIFSTFGVEHLLHLHKSGKKNMGKSLYTLVNLALWYKRYID